jgi:hypothetical protein
LNHVVNYNYSQDETIKQEYIEWQLISLIILAIY